VANNRKSKSAKREIDAARARTPDYEPNMRRWRRKALGAPRGDFQFFWLSGFSSSGTLRCREPADRLPARMTGGPAVAILPLRSSCNNLRIIAGGHKEIALPEGSAAVASVCTV